MKNQKSNIKKRYWSFIVYTDSAPDNWVEILTSNGAVCAISPLHNQDFNELTGEVKKEHYHVLIAYQGPTTFNTVNNICKELNSPIPIAIESIKGAYRYLTHKDNPEKAQYNDNDIKLINGFNIYDFIELNSEEKIKIKIKILNIIEEQDIYEFVDLIKVITNGNYENLIIDTVFNNSFFFNMYLKSKRFKKFGK